MRAHLYVFVALCVLTSSANGQSGVPSSVLESLGLDALQINGGDDRPADIDDVAEAQDVARRQAEAGRRRQELAAQRQAARAEERRRDAAQQAVLAVEDVAQLVQRTTAELTQANEEVKQATAGVTHAEETVSKTMNRLEEAKEVLVKARGEVSALNNTVADQQQVVREMAEQGQAMVNVVNSDRELINGLNPLNLELGKLAAKFKDARLVNSHKDAKAVLIETIEAHDKHQKATSAYLSKYQVQHGHLAALLEQAKGLQAAVAAADANLDVANQRVIDAQDLVSAKESALRTSNSRVASLTAALEKANQRLVAAQVAVDEATQESEFRSASDEAGSAGVDTTDVVISEETPGN